jgi:hypothetical protein
MAASTRVFIAEPMPLLALRLQELLHSHGITAEIETVPRAGLWFLNLDRSQSQMELLIDLDDIAGTAVILSSAREQALADASRIYSCVVATLARPFTGASLLAHVRDTASIVQEPARSVSGALDTSMELDAAVAATLQDLQPVHTAEVPPARSPEPSPPSVVNGADTESAIHEPGQLTISAFAEAGADLLPLWAELPRAERLEALTEFLQRLARQLES